MKDDTEIVKALLGGAGSIHLHVLLCDMISMGVSGQLHAMRACKYFRLALLQEAVPFIMELPRFSQQK